MIVMPLLLDRADGVLTGPIVINRGASGEPHGQTRFRMLDSFDEGEIVEKICAH